jgi:hypothetical protein
MRPPYFFNDSSSYALATAYVDRTDPLTGSLFLTHKLDLSNPSAPLAAGHSAQHPMPIHSPKS